MAPGSKKGRVWWCIVVCVGAAVAQDAHAQCEEADEQRARELFTEGVEADGRGELEGAIRSFLESYNLCPRSAALYNAGILQMASGQARAAFLSLRLMGDRYGEDISAEARADVTSRLETLGALVAQVDVQCSQPGAQLLVDGEQVGTLPLGSALVLEPGEHSFEAAHPGFRSTSTTVQLAGGQSTEVTLVLEPEPAPQEPEPAPQEPDGPPIDPNPFDVPTQDLETHPQQRPAAPGNGADDPEPGSFWRTPWPWVIAGAIILGASGAAIGLTVSAHRHPDPDATLRFR